MKTKNIRKIVSDSNGYGILNVPSRVYRQWIAQGFTHCRVVFDDDTNTLTYQPLMDDCPLSEEAQIRPVAREEVLR